MDTRCFILFFDDHIGFSPTIINISKIMEKQGNFVTIFARKNENISQPEKIGKEVKVIYFSKIFNSNRFLYKYKAKIFIQSFAYMIRSNHQAKKNKETIINIGVDLYGLAVALVFYYFFRQKFIFLSLELSQPGKFKHIMKIGQRIAKLAYSKSECVIVQDEDRLKTLCDFYQYHHPKVFYLPNSPLNDWSPDVNTRNFFREKLNLSEEKFPYIVLHAGMIDEDLVHSKLLARAFASIDNGCVLIFHVVGRGKFTEKDSYIQSFRQVNSKNLFFSLDALPYDQVYKIFSSATIGVAFYANVDDNFTKIAKASGKLAQYLMHGKPVLVSNLPSLSQLVEKYQFGIVINDPFDPQELKLALDKILSFYDTYSNNAKLCFDAEFNFEKNMEPILSLMNSLQAGS